MEFWFVWNFSFVVFDCPMSTWCIVWSKVEPKDVRWHKRSALVDWSVCLSWLVWPPVCAVHFRQFFAHDFRPSSVALCVAHRPDPTWHNCQWIVWWSWNCISSQVRMLNNRMGRHDGSYGILHHRYNNWQKLFHCMWCFMI